MNSPANSTPARRFPAAGLECKLDDILADVGGANCRLSGMMMIADRIGPELGELDPMLAILADVKARLDSAERALAVMMGAAHGT